jgi:predicted ATPase with chaperone activity
MKKQRLKIKETAPEIADSSDFLHIRGQEACKRAMLIAMAGNHSIFLLGPTGCGKTMLIEAAVVMGAVEVLEFTVETQGYPEEERKTEIHEMKRMGRLADMHVEVPNVPYRELVGKSKGTDSAYFCKKLEEMAEYEDLTLGEDSLLLGKQAFDEMKNMNPRSFNAAIRVARTIANLDTEKQIGVAHFAEALQYRLF